MRYEDMTRVDRRTLIASLGAAGLVLSSTTLRAQAQARAGTLVWARPSETTLYNPHNASQGSSWQLHHLIYDALVTLDEDLNVVPNVAESWEWQDDTLVFTLRPGVRFANGREMTLDDVVGSIEYTMQASSPWPLLLRNLRGVSARGGNQVAIEFDGPNALALVALSASIVAILPMEEMRDGSFDIESPMMMGTGPFQVESHVVNDRWVLTRNPHFWGDGPMVERMEVRNIPSAQGLVAALANGTTHIATFEANPDAPDLLASVANVSYVTQQQTGYHFLALNAVREGGLFTDLRVRQAVALAIDRQQIIDFVYGGATSPTHGFSHFGIDEGDLPLGTPDRDRARALLAEAGAAGSNVTLVYAVGDVNSAIAQILQLQMAEIGLNLRLESLELGVWLSRTWGANPSDFEMTLAYYAGFGTPLFTAHWWAPEHAPFTRGHVAPDPVYSELLEQAMFGDGEVQATAFRALAARMNETANKIPLCLRSETVAWRNDLVDMTPSQLQSQENVMAGIENFALRG